MRYIDLQVSFEREINKLQDGLTKPDTDTTEYFLNAGLDKFWKTRYSQNNYKRESFEQTQKRIDDLRTLVTEETYSENDISRFEDGSYCIVLPGNYIILLGDTAGIQPADDVPNKCWPKNGDEYVTVYSDTIEAKIETLDRIRENSLSEHRLRYNKARPIKLVQGDYIRLYTDGTYKISEYILQYLRKPMYIDIHKSPYEEYTDMPQHTHLEIVKLAVQLYLENQGNQRYNSYSVEVNAME